MGGKLGNSRSADQGGREKGEARALQFRMGQMGMTRTDLVKYLGSRSRVTEVLPGKQSLSLNMVKVPYLDIGIPAESLFV